MSDHRNKLETRTKETGTKIQGNEIIKKKQIRLAVAASWPHTESSVLLYAFLYSSLIHI